MINKTFRLSNGFWHIFLPNSNKLFSPQNIQIEIWDIERQIKEGKFHPGLFCIKNITISNNGDKFVFRGGCNYGESIFRIYQIDTLNCVDEFVLMEECCNPIFTNDDQNLIFGTWDGDIYHYNLNEKIYKKCFSMENHMFTLISSGKHNDIIYIASSEIGASRKLLGVDNSLIGFISEYNIKENTQRRIDFKEDRNPYEINGQTSPRINGLSLYKNNLAIMTSFYAGTENDNIVHEAKVYVYNTDTTSVKLIKENFKIKDVFYDFGSIVWSNDGRLAFIGLDEIYIIDMENVSEKTIKHEKATSVEFTNCGTGIAVGGTKAKLYKL
jgi:WD40 repeat protein